MKKVIPMDEELAAMIGENNVMSDVERMGKAVEEDFELNVELRNKIMKPSEIENFDDIPLQVRQIQIIYRTVGKYE